MKQEEKHITTQQSIYFSIHNLEMPIDFSNTQICCSHLQKIQYVLQCSSLGDFLRLAVTMSSVATCFHIDFLLPPGLSVGRRWRGRWTGSAGRTGSTRVSTAGWSLDSAGSPPPASCWASKASLPSPLSGGWTCRRPCPRSWSTEQDSEREVHTPFAFYGDYIIYWMYL